MAFSTVRKATDADLAAVAAAAEKFCTRHGIDATGMTAESAINCTIETDPRLRRLWRQIMRRALGDAAYEIAYGYVGCSVN